MENKIIIANFKMNQTPAETKKYLEVFLAEGNIANRKLGLPVVGICPPATSLYVAAKKLAKSQVKLGVQNVSEFAKGAYTGEISVAMAKDCNVSLALVGHSERRTLMGETNEIVAQKLQSILNGGLTAVLCIGETKNERENGSFEKIISTQLTKALEKVSKELFAKVIIAYEPVWAIGTGISASEEQIAEAAKFIRSTIKNLYDSQTASNASVLYGGSVSEKNKQFLSIKGINGGLVGGASLDPVAFAKLSEF